MNRRVVITSVGLISAVGKTAQESFDNAVNGVHGVDKITRFDTTNHKVKLACEVKDFNPADYMDAKEAKRIDRYSQFALAAAKEALEGIDFEKIDRTRVGVYVASGTGGLETTQNEAFKLKEKGPSRISPFTVPAMIPNMAAAHISMQYGLMGSSLSIVTACASATHSIGEGFRAIKHGYMDMCVCGGAEAAIVEIGMAAFANMHALHTGDDKDRASIPFDKERSGFVMGEGAGILVLETLESATARGAEILCEVLGYGSTSDAYHITSPHPEGKGATLAVKNALDEAGIDMVDYINAHGTSTPLNDKYETITIKNAFGDRAKEISISSTKSVTGHMLGAAGATEAIFSAFAIRDGIVPPTVGYKVPDEECDLDYTPNVAKKREINYALSNSLGFGGHNATIVLGKVK